MLSGKFDKSGSDGPKTYSDGASLDILRANKHEKMNTALIAMLYYLYSHFMHKALKITMQRQNNNLMLLTY